MAKQRDRMRLNVSREHDNLMLMTTFRGETPCVTAATDSMVEVDPPQNPIWVYLPLHAVVADIVSENDNRSIRDLERIVMGQVRKGIAAGKATRQKERR